VSTGESDTATACIDGAITIGPSCYKPYGAKLESSLAVAAGDFDGDGSVDVVAVCPGASAYMALCLLTRLPDDTWSATATLDIPWWGTAEGQVHGADLDADGIHEVVAADSGHIGIFRMVGDQWQEAESISQEDGFGAQFFPFFPAIPVDIDGDARSEILIGHGFQGASVWGHGNGVWQPLGIRHKLPSCGDLEHAMAIDLDGSGGQDIVAIGSHDNCEDHPDIPGGAWNRVAFFRADEGSTDLVEIQTLPSNIAADHVIVGDFDGDGAMDAAVSDHSIIALYQNSGGGMFEPIRPLVGLIRAEESRILAADVDGDGDHEIVAPGLDGGYVVFIEPFTEIATLSVDTSKSPLAPKYPRVTARLNDDAIDDFIFRMAKVDSGWNSPIFLISEE
jgi:hypothetical protein